jgi:SAM-dependent methyltransferase
MFLRRRTMQAEYFDAQRPEAELADFYRSLGRVNRFFAFAQLFERLVPENVRADNCQSLSLLDLGAGDGALGKELNGWAARRHWNWQVTNLDYSLAALRLNPAARNVVASAVALPFRAASYDLVISSQMAHHLADDAVVQLLREAWRVARYGILISDLHRNLLLYSTLWLVLNAQRHPHNFRADGLLSVRRGWRAGELKRLGILAGLPTARVTVLFGARIILQAWKPGASELIRKVSRESTDKL